MARHEHGLEPVGNASSRPIPGSTALEANSISTHAPNEDLACREQEPAQNGNTSSDPASRSNSPGPYASMPIGQEIEVDKATMLVGRGMGHQPVLVDRGIVLQPVPVAPTDSPSRDERMTVDAISIMYNAALQRWKGSTGRPSPCRVDLEGYLESQRPTEGWQITEAICLGTGSFSRRNKESWKLYQANCERHIKQFVIFRVVVEYLQSASDTTINMLAQELEMYTPTDIEFLERLGSKVVQIPVSKPLPGEQPWPGKDAVNRFGPSSFVCEFSIGRQPDFFESVMANNVKLLISSMPDETEKLEKEEDAYTRFLHGLPVGKEFPSFEQYHDPGLEFLGRSEMLAEKYQAWRFFNHGKSSDVSGRLAVFTRKPGYG
ncbi:hypothetical protein LTR85_000979 [Meristemomyces frigidus]|nr:hypothetical protein LTR85_000979 [Meristemomyces frigidus]